jgi:glycogen debranching enzyme
MRVLDCADPSMSVDRRNETLNALQALALMNNQLTVAMAKHFAARMEREAETAEARIKRAFRVALGREPSVNEQAALVGFAQQHGLANACRVILNLNEFAFVD